MEGLDFYHVCTNGLSRDLMFQDEEDYIYGMNCVPICKVVAGVLIYAFCLMSNHVHFILRGCHDNVLKFITAYRKLISRRTSIKYKVDNPFLEADICLKKIDTPEYLLTAIAYVLRNPMGANMKFTPAGYRWSSGNLYFADPVLSEGGSARLGELSVTRRRSILHTRVDLPDDYRIDAHGMILPVSYIEYEQVEKMYQSPKQFIFYLSKNNDAQIEADTGILTKTRYRDEELKASLEAISLGLCKKGFGQLPIEQRYRVAREMYKRYAVPPRQLARITGLDAGNLKVLTK